MGFHKTIRRGCGLLFESFHNNIINFRSQTLFLTGQDREVILILYQILTCADCLGAATDSVGRLITAEREQLYREVFGKNVGLVL